MCRLGDDVLFTDRSFFILLAVTFALFYARRTAAWQIGILLIASLIFYAYSQPYLLVLLTCSAILTTVTSYRVDRSETRHARRMWALCGVALNLFILGFFKYDRLVAATFFSPHPGGVWETLLAIPLPIGISFYTFHGISLLVDVFRARTDAKTPSPLGPQTGFPDHGVRTFFYLTFFPQLIAGPIVKAKDFYPQMTAKAFGDIDWYEATKAMITGFFLKSVIADNLAQQTFVLQPPYCYPYSTLNLLIVLLGYSVQIFADFAGYSLIAIGLAKLFGYALPDNFRFPYIAQTFSEFWTRWHMSLSAWLRDYVYYPLGGNRRGRGRTYFNLLLVMALGGLWHGAGWSYAIWGLWHGGALAIERVFRDSRFYSSQAMLMQTLRWALVFTVVTLGWLLFKLPDFAQVKELAQVLVRNRDLPFSPGMPFLIFLYCSPVVLYHLNYLMRGRLFAQPLLPRGPRAEAMALGVMLCLIAVQAGSPTPFIYFQF